MKLNIICFVLVTLLIHSSCTGESLTKSRQKPKKTRPVNLDIADSQIYFEGWVKYYHYGNDTRYEKPPMLFQNDEFFKQRIPRNKLDQRDKFGSKHIPNKASFFLVLYNKSLSIFSQRNNPENHLVDTLRIDHIRYVPEDDILRGGIRDGKDFSFGYCIEIFANVPMFYSVKKVYGVGNAETWWVCTNTAKEKEFLLETLIKVRVKHQRLRNNGLKITKAVSQNTKRIKPGIGSMIASPLPKKDSSAIPVNGYWVLLQDWTSCSKKCGGGLTYQHRMCIPPKAGGKDCVGESLLRKPCNTHNCPSVNSLLALINKDQKKSGALAPKPIVQAGVFSNKPQRYSKCKVKENDAFIMTKVTGSLEPIRKPIRIVMNLQTISIFNDDTYQELYYSFELDKTRFLVKQEHCCFGIKDNWKDETICGYKEYCGPKTQNIWTDGWSKDIKLFKEDCKVEVKSMKTHSYFAEADIQDEVEEETSEIMQEV